MKIYFNAHIYKKDETAFVVDDDKFFEFGNNGLLTKYKDCEQIDLNGGYVYPGFNDSHMHLLNYGVFLCSFSLYEHTSSIKDLQDFLKEKLKNVEKGKIIKCRGFNQDYFEEKRMLAKNDLDEISRDVGLVLVRACGHICVLNSKAIEMLHFTDEDTNIERGTIDLENGLFTEFALNLVYERMPEPTIEELEEYIISGMKALNTYGVTSCQSDDFETFPNCDYRNVIEAYKELEDEGLLTVRVNEQCQLKDIGLLKNFINEGYKDTYNDKYLKMGPLKLLEDGSLGARTASLTNGYYDDRDNKGQLIYSQEEMDELVSFANKNGMGVCVHCIGDGALDVVLNSFKKSMKDDYSNPLNNAIVHVQVTRKDQIEDILKYHISCYIQSIFIDYDSKIVFDLLDKELAETSYQFKTYYDGTNASNGSDCPVELPNVLKGMECGITRCSIGYDKPYLIEQALSVDEAIDTYTINGAKMTFEDNIKGKIEKGYLADFNVLEEDIASVETNTIHNIKVLATYLGGKKVY